MRLQSGRIAIAGRFFCRWHVSRLARRAVPRLQFGDRAAEVTAEPFGGLMAGLVVDVAHRGGEMAVAHPVLDVHDVGAGGDRLRAERVTQVVETQAPDPARSWALT